MPTFKDKAQLQRDKLRFRKESQAEQLLVEFLQSREKPEQEYEIKLFLEERGARYDMEKEQVREDLRDQLQENANPEEREEARLDLWSQIIYLHSSSEQKQFWVQKAREKEPLESLL